MAHIMADISTGRRLYVKTKNRSEPIIDVMKDKIGSGFHWDGDHQAWWCSPKHRAIVEEALVAQDKQADDDQAMGVPEKQEDPHKIRLTGKGVYQGREYYAGPVSIRTGKVLLLTLPDKDGKYLSFWKPCDQVRQTKEYKPRPVWNGLRGRHSAMIEKYQTLGSMADFIKSQKEKEAEGADPCAACGKRSHDLHHDLEDGMMKCYRCCDIPE